MRLHENRRRVHAIYRLTVTVAVLVFVTFVLNVAYSAFLDQENWVMTARGETIFGSQEQLLARRSNASTSEVNHTILMWTTYFGSRPTILLDKCPHQDRCKLTYDRSLNETAAAVVFHLQDVSAADLLKTPSFSGQKFVAFTQESPLNRLIDYRELPSTWNSQSYFHWSMTYLNVSDVAFPYGGPWIPREVAQKRGIPPLNITYDKEGILQRKKVRGAVWFVSNCKAASGRERAISALSRFFRVDVAGKCGSKANFTSLCPRRSNCESVFGQYYFYVAAENSICKDYITEKYWERVRYPSVPIVLRRYVYEEHLPPNSFIAMDDFESPSAMAARLTYLMDNPVEYMAYFAWREHGLTLLNYMHAWTGMCNLCARLVRGDYDKKDERIPDFAHWYSSQSRCEDDGFATAWSESNTSTIS